MVWDELPEGWEVRRLGNVCEVVGGGTPRRNRPEYFGGQIPWVRPSDLPPIGEVIPVSGAAEYITEAGLQNSSAKLLPVGTVLFSSRASIGKIAIAQVKLATNQGFANFICDGSVIDNWYLAYALRCFTPAIEALAGKTTFKEVGRTKLREFEIPLPPLPEQRRIVARIEELTKRIDAARRLRAEAVEEADAIVPTAALEVFRELECEKVPLGEVTESSRYGTSKRASSEPVGYPMLRMNNVTLDGKLDLADLKYVQLDEREFAKLRLHPGDIVVNRTNSKELVGKCAVFHVQDADYVFASYLIRFRLNGSEADPDYVVYYLSSPLGREQIDARSHGATNQFNINSAELKSIPIPLPPLDEQRRIVEYLNALQAKVEAIRRYQEETRQEIETMTGAVLERAFRGEL